MIDPEKYGTITEAANAADITRGALRHAIDRGDITQTVATHGGTTLVSIDAAITWSQNRPPRGPRPRDPLPRGCQRK